MKKVVYNTGNLEMNEIDDYVKKARAFLINDNDEVFKYDENTRAIIADLWSRVKVVASNAE